jgi:hypothetical protein
MRRHILPVRPVRISYVPRKFGPASLDIISMANTICAEYQAQGLDITLRQLYYQFVARGYIPNKQSEYKRLGGIVNDARLAGLIDWDYIVDRTRNIRSMSHWENPADIIKAVSHQFRHDKWAAQPTMVEVWVEKDALVGVLDSVCPDLDVAYFSCRGYTSQSEVWGAAQRLGAYMERGQDVVVVHLGDHDPSGIDMSRDIEDRIRLFTDSDIRKAAAAAVHKAIELGDMKPLPEDDTDHSGPEWEAAVEYVRNYRADRGNFTLNRIALNMDQVEEYDPPPNPAKLTDSRAANYVIEHGDSSWELDALDPTTLVNLITEAVAEHRDEDLWEQAVEDEETAREQLTAVSNDWETVVQRTMTLAPPEDDSPPPSIGT